MSVDTVASNTYAISVKRVYKSFKQVKAVNGISLDFDTGSMHGVIGPEGAGKTTLMRLILHLLKPDSGQVDFILDSNSIDFETVRPAIAYMPEQQSLYADLSVYEHLEFFKELYGISTEDFKVKSTELLRITRLETFKDRPAGKLSGGMYKKLGLMCALLRSPKIILLDEPTNGVDPISRREFWELLYRLIDQNLLIILTTAYMDEAERCGKVHLLKDGQLVASGEPRQLLQQANVDNFTDYYLRQSKHE